MVITVKKLIKNSIAEFTCYRDGDLWYRIVTKEDSDEEFTFDFPVPISDTGTGIFPASIKSIILMRWIRKHLEAIQKGEWK